MLVLCFVCVASTRSQTNPVRSSTLIGLSIQASKDRAEVPHTELLLAANPADPKRLWAGSMLRYEGSEDQCIGYLSTDGGASWKPVLKPRGRAETRGVKRAAAPCVAFGPNATPYFVMLAAASHLEYHHTVVYRSTDSGQMPGTGGTSFGRRIGPGETAGLTASADGAFHPL